MIDDWGISCEIVFKWMSLDLTSDKSTLVYVIAWCRQAASHNLNQCWPSSMLLYGIIRSEWVKFLWRLLFRFQFTIYYQWFRTFMEWVGGQRCGKLLPVPMMTPVQWHVFIHEKTFENVVCKMSAILSRSQCVQSIMRPRKNGREWHFQTYFLEWKCLNFD